MIPEYRTHLVTGSDFVRLFTFPYDITGFSFEAKLVSRDGSSEVATLTTTPDAPSQTVEIALSAASSANLTPGEVRGYLMQIDDSGKRSPIVNLRCVVARPGI